MRIAHQIACFALMASCAAIAAPRVAQNPAQKPAQKPAAAKPPAGKGLQRYGMAVYSDLCVHPGSGEFGGQRISVQRFAEVDTVIYEFTAGGLSWPIVASDVNIGPNGAQMYFTVELDGEERTISGKFKDNGATLVLDGGFCGQPGAPATLRKVTDFGRQPAACKPCPEAPPAPLEEAPEQPERPERTRPGQPTVPQESPVKQAAPATQST
ncbi:hypothetical protein [Pseudoduganella namucuonensis]|uniref:Uncharacterized protein n=1 Tax=Pseudoduganella namucuonensis TaxID=1035707 RepID=A0A1I7EYG3_9BURK|nr:hypothetical protein [Pseudoduganella namucuonensis]SFU28970.1 hypothetical protein SAMN05216552_1001241 [Pseudoduganella namucuonensis]